MGLAGIGRADVKTGDGDWEVLQEIASYKSSSQFLAEIDINHYEN